MTGVRDTGTGGETRDLGSGETGAQPGAGGVLPLAASQPFFTDSPRSASGGPISDERLAEIAKRERNDTFTELGYGRAIRELLTEVARLRAVLTQQEAALRRIADDFYCHYEGDPTSIARAALEGTQE